MTLGHIHLPPGFPLVVGDLEGGGVTGEALGGVGAQPVGKNPPAVGQHLDGLAAEGALPGEDGLVGPPGQSAVGALLEADLGGELHVVLPRLAVPLGGVHGPDGAIRAVEEGGVLLAALRVAGDVHGLRPAVRPLGQAGADDVDVGAALIGAGKPAAQQVPVRELQRGGGVAGGVDAGGDDGLHGAHLQVLIENAVGGQSGQNRIAHTIISLSQNFERISGEGGTAEPFRPQLVRGGSSRFEVRQL